MPTIPLRERPAWKALEQHYSEIGGQHLRELFAGEPGRGERLTAEAAGLYLDYSKNRITDETLRLLIQLAQESGLEQRRDMMLRGERINVSENRPVLHIALRMPKGSSLVVDGVDVVAQVHEVLDRMSGLHRAECVPANGKALPEKRSKTWSMSASVARTSAR